VCRRRSCADPLFFAGNQRLVFRKDQASPKRPSTGFVQPRPRCRKRGDDQKFVNSEV
jgi:hypothetical protein